MSFVFFMGRVIWIYLSVVKSNKPGQQHPAFLDVGKGNLKSSTT